MESSRGMMRKMASTRIKVGIAIIAVYCGSGLCSDRAKSNQIIPSPTSPIKPAERNLPNRMQLTAASHYELDQGPTDQTEFGKMQCFHNYNSNFLQTKMKDKLINYKFIKFVFKSKLF